MLVRIGLIVGKKRSTRPLSNMLRLTLIIRGRQVSKMGSHDFMWQFPHRKGLILCSFAQVIWHIRKAFPSSSGLTIYWWCYWCSIFLGYCVHNWGRLCLCTWIKVPTADLLSLVWGCYEMTPANNYTFVCFDWRCCFLLGVDPGPFGMGVVAMKHVTQWNGTKRDRVFFFRSTPFIPYPILKCTDAVPCPRRYRLWCRILV